MSQTDSHVEHEYDPFIKWVSCVNPNMTQNTHIRKRESGSNTKIHHNSTKKLW